MLPTVWFVDYVSVSVSTTAVFIFAIFSLAHLLLSTKWGIFELVESLEFCVTLFFPGTKMRVKQGIK